MRTGISIFTIVASTFALIAITLTGGGNHINTAGAQTPPYRPPVTHLAPQFRTHPTCHPYGHCKTISPPPTTTTSPPPTSPPPTSPACVIQMGGNCGAYVYFPQITMSRGFNTYVSDQGVGPQSGTTSKVTAFNPGNWSALVNAVPYGYGGVQVYPSVQQKTDNWCPAIGTWDSLAPCPNGGPETDTPVNRLTSLTLSYNETGPTGPNDIYQWAPDLWTNYAGQLGGGSGDIMFWTDTHGRCNEGSYGSTILGTAVIDGQTWTVNRYGPPGAEIIFVLDSNPAVPNSCAQQKSGTVNILAGIQWLNAHGISPQISVVQLLTGGWEITSAQNSTFTVTSFSIHATAA